MAAIARTVITVKPGEWDALIEFGKSLADRVSAIDGLISWGWAETAENEVTTLVVYKDREAAESAAPVAAGLFAEMASMIAAPPQREVLNAEWFGS